MNMMDDGMLSQDEIDALLSMNDEEAEDEQTEEKDAARPIKNEDYLSAIEEDTIGEIGNISFGNSATTLSTLLNQKVSITTPQVSIVRKQELNKAFSFEHVKVQVNYESGLDRKSTRLNSSHVASSYAVFCLKKKKTIE